MGVFRGTNFLSGHLSGKGTLGKKAWDYGKSQGFSNQQLKVAVQQLEGAGIRLNPFFTNPSTNPRRGHAGMYSDRNPLGKFQGSGGDFGLEVYQAAADAGHDWRFIEKHLPASGMQLQSGSQARFDKEKAAAEAEELAGYQSQIDEAIASIQQSDPYNKPMSTYSQGSSTNPASAGLTINQGAANNDGGVNSLKRKKRPKDSMSIALGAMGANSLGGLPGV